MNTNDALTTTTAQVETILTDHSITYTTTDNRGEEDGDYRITVSDTTAYFSLLDDGDVWATTDENPADAYDGPANADEIALHLMHYASEVPAVVAVLDAIGNETEGDVNISYWDGYWEVEDSHTTVEVDTAGDWTVTQSDVDGIDWTNYEGKDVAAVFEAGAMAYGQPLDAITTVIMGGDYEMAIGGQSSRTSPAFVAPTATRARVSTTTGVAVTPACWSPRSTTTRNRGGSSRTSTR